jgi:hypothetical protein
MCELYNKTEIEKKETESRFALITAFGFFIPVQGPCPVTPRLHSSVLLELSLDDNYTNMITSMCCQNDDKNANNMALTASRKLQIC